MKKIVDLKDIIFPKMEYYTINDMAKLNNISHRRAERILNDVVNWNHYFVKLKSKYNKKVKFYYTWKFQ